MPAAVFLIIPSTAYPPPAIYIPSFSAFLSLHATFYFFLLLSSCCSAKMNTMTNVIAFRTYPQNSLQPSHSHPGVSSQCFIPFLSTALGNQPLPCRQLPHPSLRLFSPSSYQGLLQVMLVGLCAATSFWSGDKCNFLCHNEVWTSCLMLGARPFVSEIISSNFQKALLMFSCAGCLKLVAYLTHADAPLNNSCIFWNIL